MFGADKWPSTEKSGWSKDAKEMYIVVNTTHNKKLMYSEGKRLKTFGQKWLYVRMNTTVHGGIGSDQSDPTCRQNF